MSEGKRDWSLAVALAALAALAICVALFSRYAAGSANRALAAQLEAPDAVWEPIREGAVIGRAAVGARARYLVAMQFAGRSVILAATLGRDAAIEEATLLSAGAHASFGRRLVAAMNGPGRAAALSYSPIDRAAASVYQALSDSLSDAHAPEGARR